jgi:hypothetical protein
VCALLPGSGWVRIAADFQEVARIDFRVSSSGSNRARSIRSENSLDELALQLVCPFHGVLGTRSLLGGNCSRFLKLGFVTGLYILQHVFEVPVIINASAKLSTCYFGLIACFCLPQVDFHRGAALGVTDAQEIAGSSADESDGHDRYDGGAGDG